MKFDSQHCYHEIRRLRSTLCMFGAHVLPCPRAMPDLVSVHGETCNCGWTDLVIQLANGEPMLRSWPEGDFDQKVFDKFMEEHMR